MSDMERGFASWNEVYCVALITVHGAVQTVLKKEGNSFAQLPDTFGSNHHEFMLHVTALIEHHTLPAQGAEIRDVSKVEDIHRYSGSTFESMGKAEEEVEVWERLLDILHHRQAAK